MHKSFALLALPALLLTGCAGPAKDAEYKDINALGSAYEQAIGDGMECSETRNKIEDHGWVQTGCGPTGIIMMFTSDAKREEIKKKNPLESGRRWIQGENWLIEADQYQAEKAQKVLGGELIG
jgi:hypothetical protein